MYEPRGKKAIKNTKPYKDLMYLMYAFYCYFIMYELFFLEDCKKKCNG